MSSISISGTDHFSGHAAAYARHRPSYPPELFAWLAGQCRQRTLAWDCGTGNGQAAHALAAHFAQVHATDLSAEQLAEATPDPRIRFHAAPAEASGLVDQSCDLVTVAQALHWFCHDAFYAEVKRVLRPGGLIAAWTYKLLDVEPAINRLVEHFHNRTVGPWWPPERKWVDVSYVGMPFPFVDVAVPAFTIHRDWTLEQLLAYLRTWSATQRYIKETGNDPTLALGEQLAAVWTDRSQTKTIAWPLAIRCGRAQ